MDHPQAVRPAVGDGAQHHGADRQRCQRRQQAKCEEQAAEQLAQADKYGQTPGHRHREQVKPIRRGAEPVSAKPTKQLLSAVAHKQ